MNQSPKNKKAEQERTLRDYLQTSGFRKGDQLPSEREIATTLGVGRSALRPLLAALETEGVLQRRPQSGTFLVALPLPKNENVHIALIAPFHGTGEPERRTDPFWFHRVASAFERVVVTAGARLTLMDQTQYLHDACSAKELSREAVRQGVQAAVLLHPLGTRNTIACALALLHDAGVHPLILSARTYPGLASQVYLDSGWGAHLATVHLLNKGHHRIGFAGASDGHEWVRERLAGYQNALAAAEITADPAWVHLPGESGKESPVTVSTGASALDYFHSLPPNQKPTALVAANDVVALGVLRRASELGILIPQSLSVIGFDNDPDALLAGLTTVDRPAESLGEVAARVVLERVAAGARADTVTYRIRPVIIERKTVGALDDINSSTEQGSKR